MEDSGITGARKPRILCLHGFRTSGQILKTLLLDRWPESVSEKLDLVFLDAPYLAEGESSVQALFDPPYFEWFQANQDFTEYRNFEECIQYIEDYMVKNGPFDGLLGFSQGAILSAALPGIQAQVSVMEDSGITGARKPRILCLHGFRTSGQILKTLLLDRWPESVSEKLDLVFLDAPYLAEGESSVQALFDPPYFEWFQANQDFTEYRNFEECIQYIEDYMVKNGPFDGLLGFSQGAILSAALPGIQAQVSVMEDSGITGARKPRILCLHGFRTSGQILKTLLLDRWPESVSEKLDLVFLDAPYLAEGESSVQALFDPPYFEWFQANQDFTEYRNFEECIQYIEDYMVKNGPFDGLLGFSQGAILSAALPGIQAQVSVMEDSGITGARKPRILCLHGFRTSGQILKTLLLDRWPESVSEKLDLVFLDAPYLAEGESSVQALFDPPYFEWFQANQDFTEYRNFEECIQYIEDYMVKNGPFDGLLGFSQGAILSAALPGIQAQGLGLTRVPKIEFLIIISGAKFGGAKFGMPKLATNAFSCPIQCPSLHFIGEMDFLKADGIALLASFVEPQVIYHPKGHTIPRLDEESLVTVCSFLNKIQRIGRPDR